MHADARGYELREATTYSLDLSAPYVFNDRAATSSHEPLIEAGPRVRKVGARCIFDFPSGFPSRASTSAKLASAARGSVLNNQIIHRLVLNPSQLPALNAGAANSQVLGELLLAHSKVASTILHLAAGQ